MTEEEALEIQRARERMVSRHKLIEGMIHNNELQLKNESGPSASQHTKAGHA